MKTISKSEYDALPEERRKYWEEIRTPTGEDGVVVWYEQLTIPLEDAERVLEEAMPKWVSVDETLPAFGKYLVYIQVLTNEPLIKTLMFYAERDNNQWEDYGQYITHWMLLPKSPTDDALTTALTI